MKKSEPNLNTTAKLWILHILVYYFVFACLHVFIIRYYSGSIICKESLNIILLSPIIGLMGFFDLFPGFIVIPIIVMLLILSHIYIGEIYKSYLVSILLVRIVHYIVAASTGASKYPFLSSQIKVNILFLIFPSLVAALLVNWYLLGKHEKSTLFKMYYDKE
ncbi:hypothetical protein [Flavobacterium hercynium]|uniref:Uncharacterized protein n=1 Tax=Flavobacterium hercynium TaxID=387094 RepID=A0A226HP89_9FLAO|nr:hypothetical protein [Flavobacterium hercynium]OXA96087.1 hypothetical protein B0A66_00460 [Flavobacterium hercynium]SMP06333.1 hypothetical protein SAMN06265346_101620 [Flavobacterium hercynium]